MVPDGRSPVFMSVNFHEGEGALGFFLAIVLSWISASLFAFGGVRLAARESDAAGHDVTATARVCDSHRRRNGRSTDRFVLSTEQNLPCYLGYIACLRLPFTREAGKVKLAL